MKFDGDMKKNLGFIAGGSLVLLAVMMGVFAILGRFNLLALLGGMIGTVVALANIFLLARTLQRAANQAAQEEVVSKARAQLGYLGRTLLMFVVAAVSIGLLSTNPIATILPLLFPRIAIAVQPLFQRENKGGEEPE